MGQCGVSRHNHFEDEVFSPGAQSVRYLHSFIIGDRFKTVPSVVFACLLPWRVAII
jgi:hypothetical protein